MDQKDIEKKMQEAWNDHATEQPKSKKDALWEEFATEAFPRVNKKRSHTWFYPAVAAVLVLSLSVVAYKYLANTSAPEIAMAYTIIENPSQNIKVVTLPDSTVVELEPDAVLRYGVHFTTNRNIELNGTAFFRVKKDKKHPFRVSCNETTTTVLGTCFTVTGCSEKTVEVHLYEGRVQMNVKGKNSNWILSPGEQFEYENGEVEVEAFNRFVDFNDTPLRQVCDSIKRTYGYSINIPKGYETKKVTLRLNKKEELKNVVGILAQMYELKAIIDEKLKKITLQ